MRKRGWLVVLLGAILLTSCMKNNNVDIDYNTQVSQQYSKDSLLISDFIVNNAIDTSGNKFGIIYQILKPGEGNHVYSQNSRITVKYNGKLLDGTVFDQTKTEAVTFNLGGLIGGWYLGVPLIQKGGIIRLLIPSYYGYGSRANGLIPANAVLDFEIELIDVE